MNFVARLKRDLAGDPDARFVFVNNFEVERSWAQGEPKLPGAGVAFAGATVNRMEEMGALLAGDGDVVVLKAAMDPEFAGYLSGLGALGGLLLDRPGRPGVLINNFATLNAAAAAGGFHGRLYGICVADSADAVLTLRQDAELRLREMAGTPLAPNPAETSMAGTR